MPNAMRCALVGAMGALALLVLTAGPAAAQPLALPVHQAAAWLPLPDDGTTADTGTGGEGEGAAPAAAPEPAPEAQPAAAEPQPAEPAAAPAEGAPVNVLVDFGSMESKTETVARTVTPAA